MATDDSNVDDDDDDLPAIDGDDLDSGPAKAKKGDEAYAAYDEMLNAEPPSNPWETDRADPVRKLYMPDLDLLREMVAIPVGQGHARKQRSGRVAKAFDAWIAHELRRAGFPPDAVWPRAKRPRVMPGDLARTEQVIDLIFKELHAAEATSRVEGTGQYIRERDLRRAIILLREKEGRLPGAGAANILGRFYVKQVDVAVSAWQRGPDILISTKTQFSSYGNNKNNRYEEAVGEATNLRERHPMAAMGFAYLVRTNIHAERGAYAYLRDLLARLRKPDGPFDATMLLAADWESDEQVTDVVAPTDERPAGGLDLSAGKFFEDIVRTVTTSTPVMVHAEVRRRRDGEPEGGLPIDEKDDVGA